MAIDSIDVTVATGATTSPSSETARHRLGVGTTLRAATVRELSGNGPVHVAIVVFRGSTLIELEGTQGWIRGGGGEGGGRSWHGEMNIDEPGWFISLSSSNDSGFEVEMQLSWEAGPTIPRVLEEILEATTSG